MPVLIQNYQQKSEKEQADNNQEGVFNELMVLSFDHNSRLWGKVMRQVSGPQWRKVTKTWKFITSCLSNQTYIAE